jgi:copper chaperone CopZ
MNQQLSYSVTGLSCSGCVNSLTNQLNELDAISDVEIDLVSGAASRLTITLTTPVEDSVVQTAITEAGYAVVGCAPTDSSITVETR